MRNEASGPAFGGVAPDANLLRPLQRLVEQDPERILAMTREGDHFLDWTVGQMAERIRSVAKGLVACGVDPGDRVALMCHTRLEWVVVDMAIMSAGAVTVPVYDTSSAEQLSWILEDSGALVAIVETDEMRCMYDALDSSALCCRRALTIGAAGKGLEELAALGADVDDAEIDRRSAALGPGDTATLIYTSGTTGRPKGCVLTHGHLCANVAQTVDAIGHEIRPDDIGLLFLPLAHSLTKGNLLFGLEMGVRTGFASDIAHLGEELGMVHASVIAAVPRVFEKVYNSAQHTAHSTRKGPIFDRAAVHGRTLPR